MKILSSPLLPVNVTLAFALVFAIFSPVKADDWPVYRGSDRNGISTESGLDGVASAEVVWEAQLGLGYSSPVISGGKVIIAGHDGQSTDTLYCLDEKTGAELWTHSYSQPLGDLYFQGGTTGTATISGDFVYHVARQGELFCLSLADGSVIWKKHLQKDFGYKMPTWGFSGAPLLHNERLYLTAGESGIALDPSNGEPIWKSDDEEAGYSTPYLFEKNGRELMIFTNKRAYVCVDPSNGEEVWSHRWMTRYGVNAADPIVTGNYIFISSGYGKGAVLLEWDGTGDPERIWQNRDMRTQMNAAVLLGGYLYGMDGNESADGTGMKCLKLETGETVWSDTSTGHGTLSAAGDSLIVLTEQGELQVGKASPEGFSPAFSKKVVAPRVWTVPVLANQRIYSRNAAGHLVVLGW